ncbi:MAG: hypothetical protein IPQ18_05015 [Saprospiraceae bacterium]|jgi:capsule polysaccharide export protein KpsE/RkpR|nr:hypothetical protein [Saprospiraceae bacterium]
MDQKNNLLGIIPLLINNRKKIFLATLVVGLCAAVFVFFIPNKYKSKAIFYAASSDMAKPEYIFGTANRGMDFYGTGEDIDRILTIANSDDLKYRLIEEFDLFTHYEIDSTQKLARTKVLKALNSKYTVTKTKFDAIEVEIEDTDPELSARMTNKVLTYINDIGLNLLKKSQMDMMQTFINNIANREKQINVLQDTLSHLRKSLKVYDVPAQMANLIEQAITTEAFMKKEEARLAKLKTIPGVHPDTIRYLTGQVAGIKAQLSSLQGKNKSDFNINTLVEGMSQIEQMTQHFTLSKEHLAFDKERLKQLEATYDAPISSIHIIEKARVPEEKSGPFRSIIILASMLGFFIFYILWIIAKDSWENSAFKPLFESE